MNRGYVRTWRKVLDSGWLKNHKLWVFWSYCLLKASHKEFDAIIGLQVVHLTPGQFVFGLKKASLETGLTIREIRTIIDFLKKAGNLTIKTTNKFSVITVINWTHYQGDNIENDTLNDKPLANKGQHTNTITHKHIINTPRVFSSDLISLKSRYQDQVIIDQVFRAIASTRKTNRITDSVTVSILKSWERFPVDQVMAGIRIYLEKDYAGQGKNEKYLLGIIRNGKLLPPKPSVRPEPEVFKCPKCKRRIVVKSDLIGQGCVYCQMEARA
jgi:hypothetical protein